MKIEIEMSDARKILKCLQANEKFHRHRDQMNSAVHMADETILSPLTSETVHARQRLEGLMSGKVDKVEDAPKV